VLAIRAKKFYNPGLFVSVFINIPIGAWSVFYLVNRGILENFFLNTHIVIGIGLNALLPIMGIILLKKYKRNKLQRS